MGWFSNGIVLICELNETRLDSFGGCKFRLLRTRRIYNCTSFVDSNYTWGDIIELGRKIVNTRMPLNGVMWYPGGSMKSSRMLHNICVILFQYIPAIILDTLIFLSGNKPVLWRVQQRLSKGSKVYEYFANNQWKFNNDEMIKAERLMNDTEKKAFPIFGRDVDIEEYFYHCTHSARLYVLKESDDTIPAARTHMKRMWVLDKFCKTLILLSFAYFVLLYFICPVFNVNF